jgi:hypothetical protein
MLVNQTKDQSIYSTEFNKTSFKQVSRLRYRTVRPLGNVGLKVLDNKSLKSMHVELRRSNK